MGVQVSDFAPAMNGRGAAVVALGRDNGRVDLVRAATTGSLVDAGARHRPGSEVYDVLVALNRAGDTFLGWGGYALYGKYRQHGGTWSGQFTISPDAGVEVLESVRPGRGQR